MKLESPAALRFIMEEDIYLLQADKAPRTEIAVQPVNEAAPAIEFNYLGQHKKKLLITVHYPDREFIDDVHLTALENILKRKDHTLDDVAIVNMANTVADIDELTAYFTPQKILILGREALPVKMILPEHNQPQKLNAYLVLYSFSFNEMMDNTDNKRIFWEQMKSF